MTDVACICHCLGENHGAKNFSAIPMTGTGQSFSDDIFFPNLLLLHHEGWKFFFTHDTTRSRIKTWGKKVMAGKVSDVLSGNKSVIGLAESEV